MMRWYAIVGLAACMAVVGAAPPGSAATSADGPIDNPIIQGTPEPAVELGRPTGVSDRAPAVKRDRPMIGNPLWAVPLRALSATHERPIFSPSRRPPPPAVVAAVSQVRAAPPKPAEPDHPLLTLVGTVIGASDGIGVFVDQTAKSVVRLRTGQDHDGWTLRAVRGREAIFRKDRRAATLSLPSPGAESSAQAAVAVPVGMPVAAAGGTWLDGDGQMIAPPKKAAQTFGLPAAGTSSGDPQ